MPSRTHTRRPGGAVRNACSTAGEKGRRRKREGERQKEKREGMNTTEFPFPTSLLRRPSNRRQTAIKTFVSARRSATKCFRSEGNLPLLLLSAGSIEVSLRSRLPQLLLHVRRLDSFNLTKHPQELHLFFSPHHHLHLCSAPCHTSLPPFCDTEATGGWTARRPLNSC